MNRALPTLLLAIIALAACDGREREPDSAAGLTVADVLGGGDTAGFERAVEPRDFHFPRDHAAHPAFRSEWWYITGNLKDNRGRRYGYQVTFFRNALAPPDQAPANPSAWTTRQVWMAHAAVTDIDGRRHEAVERFSRAEPGLAGARLDPPRVWLHDWRLTGDGDTFPARLEVAGEAFSLQLTLTAEKPPVLHGDAGLSRKGHEPGNASYYYSYTRLKTRGTLDFRGNTVPVTGSSWLDREWSTGAMDDSHTGWDWFALQFDNGEELMYYRLRDENGDSHPNSEGSWVGRDGQRRRITADEIELTELDHWQSPTGRRYPVRWRLHYRPQNKTWLIRAAVDDQFMDVSFPYWEGAIEIRNADNRALVGRGYLEMVRD